MTTIHASCVVIGEAGVLIRGASGTGKSTLARSLAGEARRDGVFARHVADDRTRLECRAGRLIARPVPAIAGMLEMRGLGLMAVEHEAAAVVRLVVDCGSEVPGRHPDAPERQVDIDGIVLPRLKVQISPDSARLVLGALRLIAPTPH